MVGRRYVLPHRHGDKTSAHRPCWISISSKRTTAAYFLFCHENASKKMAAATVETLPVGDDLRRLNGAQEASSIDNLPANGLTPKIESVEANSKPKNPYELPSVPLIDRFIDEPRSLRVAVIGGGLAGILAGILLPAKVPGIELTIIEKNKDFVSESG